MAGDEKLRAYLRRVTVDLHSARARLLEVEQQSREPVAIVGIGCRYPGGVHSAQELWELLERGQDAVGPFPSDRGWDLERLYHPDPEQPGTSYVREAGFLEDAAGFDADFFGIGPREALAMDPQHRVLLEISWEALEDAGMDPLALRGTRTGVFTGVSGGDYSALLFREPQRELEGYMGLGTAPSVLSGRVAYHLGLEGPALTIDTACSASLVAMHLACGALRGRECGLALAGGVTVVSSPAVFVEFARTRGLAPDGRSKAFADSADGAGWGEGAGVLALELLSEAERNGHRVLGVLRGSAVNQDGASNGLTAPNGPSQQRVIRQALANAGLAERQVDAVEAHGTGTMLGDPIEAHALIATYGAQRDPGRPLWIGSIKSNIGHTQAAAGVAGVIKMVMAMRHGLLPKTLHVDAPSSKIDWSTGTVVPLTQATRWERGEEPRRAGVSSFGMSGTNAHAILEEAPPPVDAARGATGGPDASGRGHVTDDPHAADDGRAPGLFGEGVTLWPLSARGTAALDGQAGRLLAFASNGRDVQVGQVASALAGRAQLEHRAAVVGGAREELTAGLEILAGGASGACAVRGRAGRAGAVFLFPGQGSQWAGMARELLECSEVFRERMHECEQALAPAVDWSLEDVLREQEGAPGLERLDVLQPVLFAVMVSLASLWRTCGVRPSAVAGHSQGEVAAACVAGGLTLRDAARVVALRSKMQAAHEGRGGMVSVIASQEHVRKLLERWGGQVIVAAFNSPTSTVLACTADEALAELLEACETQGIRARAVKAARGASHSPQVDALREELLQALDSLKPRKGELPFYSTVTCGLLDTRELNADYWYRNMREPVRFAPAIRRLVEEGHRTFVEVSAHPVLAGAVQETIDELSCELPELAEEPPGVLGSLRREQGGPARFLTSLGEAWVRGVEVDWKTVLGSPAGYVGLPTYQFQRERYWVSLAAPVHGLGHPEALPGERRASEPPADEHRDIGEPRAADERRDVGESRAADERRDGGESRPADERRDGGESRPTGERQAGGEQPSAGELPAAGALAARLAPLDSRRRHALALDIVRSQAAAVLGFATPERVDPRRAFKDMGFDSVMAVELRNKLQAATGLALEGTLVFNQPTPAALGRFLVEEATGGAPQLAPVARRGAPDEEPVAIVGMSCRFPGGVRSPEELWELLAAGRDAICGFPGDRGWDLERLFHPDPDRRGTSYVSEGGFLHDAADFDAAFFGISPREALTMDPQHRLLLEGCWEAFEDAGIDPTTLHGTETGVYMGCAGQDYSAVLFGADLEDTEGYRVAGGMASMASGRVAYALGLEGPAVSIDTACSSSLVAIHLACQALRSGECSLALAGGATVMSTPVLFVELSRQRGLARDGRCKAFAAGADGTSFSEGVGVLTLARLSDARRHGWNVLAVIRGSAVNQDGASNGMTAPNGRSQERVIRQALANAGVAPQDVDAVEAHGTGTALGDPIEARALLAAYGRERPKERPLWLGSIKSNIGHTSGAAGVAGVIKMVLALRHGELPPTLHANEPSADIDWAAGSVSLLLKSQPWRGEERPRRAGVSSFGASGTNAHLVLEEAPDRRSPAASTNAAGEDGQATGVGLLDAAVPWVLSGRGSAALGAQAERLSAHLKRRPSLGSLDVGRSLAGRPLLEDRAVVVGSSRDQALDALGALEGGAQADGLVSGSARPYPGHVVFVFPGQGSQWRGMAVELLESSPRFAAQLRACGEALEPFVDWSLEDVLLGASGSPGLERIDVVQPVLFAVMVSLADLWRASGVVPDAVIGHSQGEIAAACIAGSLSLQDAARISALRSRLLTGLVGRGGIVSIAVGEQRARSLLDGWGERLSISAINSPSAVAVAGDLQALGELLALCESEGVRARQIAETVPTHSVYAEELREQVLSICAEIEPRAGELPFYSTVTGGVLDGAELDGEYWYRNLRQPVELERALRAQIADGARTFVEISPHPVLGMSIGQTVDAVVEDGAGAKGRDFAIVGSLRRGMGGGERFLTSLAEAWVRGVEIDWNGLFEHSGAQFVRLPGYAFQRRRFWPEPHVGALGGAVGWWSGAGRTGGVDNGVAPAQAPDGVPDGSSARLPAGSPERGLGQRVAAAVADRRAEIVLEFLMGELARVLGHSSSAALDPERTFLDLGLTSLMAVELRNRVSAAVGVSLPNALAFDHPTPQAAAAFVAGRLTAALADSEIQLGGGRGAALEEAPQGGLSMLFREAHQSERLGEFAELLFAASRFRPTFATAGDMRATRPVRLSPGSCSRALVCFPSAVAMSGPHEYARLARFFEDREVTALPEPGFIEGELLPKTLDALVELQAAAVREHTGDSEFVLVGHSSGGIVAHAVASCLEGQGVSVAAVVLIDTFTFDTQALVGASGVALEKEGAYGLLNDTRLTAMGAYLRILAGWKPAEIAAPLLLARATEPLPGIDPQQKWRASWEQRHEAVDLPGHHFSVMEEHAEATARAVGEWLSTTLDKQGVMNAC